MSRKTILIWAVVAASLLVVACGGGVKKSKKLSDDIDSLSYVLGTNIAYNLLKMDSTVRVEAVMAGLEDALRQQERISLDEGRIFLLGYMNYDIFERVRKFEEQYLNDLAASDAEVMRTQSGLTYKVMQLGDMNRVVTSDRDSVGFTYSVTTLDGKEVDAAEEREDTLRAIVSQLPEGLREGVKLVGVGGELTLWVPSSMAYGSQGDSERGIGANQMLRYQIKMVQAGNNR
jgi:FKBP-type peptidyl-prolyl cis-trans isomerase FkpA